MARRNRIDPRAKASGFAPKLRAWTRENLTAHQEGRSTGLPHNKRQLYLRIEGMGEPCSPSTVQAWFEGRNLPESRFIASIERLLLAPWSYLDDPATKWPPPTEEARIYEVILSARARELARIGAALRAVLDAKREPSR